MAKQQDAPVNEPETETPAPEPEALEAAAPAPAPPPAPVPPPPAPKEQGSPALPDHLRPGLARGRGVPPGFTPVEEHPEILARIQDPSGSLARVAPENQCWVDGYDSYGHPCRIPI
jgi:hypothetical protein